MYQYCFKSFTCIYAFNSSYNLTFDNPEVHSPILHTSMRKLKKERLTNQVKIAQLVSERASIWTHATWLHV